MSARWVPSEVPLKMLRCHCFPCAPFLHHTKILSHVIYLAIHGPSMKTSQQFRVFVLPVNHFLEHIVNLYMSHVSFTLINQTHTTPNQVWMITLWNVNILIICLITWEQSTRRTKTRIPVKYETFFLRDISNTLIQPKCWS